MKKEKRFSVPEHMVLLGIVLKPHGTQGSVVVRCFSEESNRFIDYKELFLVDGNGRISAPLTVESSRKAGKNVAVRFAGITAIKQTNEMMGAGVVIEKKCLPQLSSNEFYWYQYQRKSVVDTKGQNIGTVEELFDNGVHVVLVVRNAVGKEVLIPAVSEFIVEEKADTLIVALPQGLLDIN